MDFPTVEDVTLPTVRKTKKMLMVLAGSCPQQPNMSALYRELETNRNLGLKMLDALQRAELLAVLDNWSSPVMLENKSGDDWTLPAGKSANFFRVRLNE